MKNKFYLLLLIMLAVVMFAACGGSGSSETEPVVLVTPTDTPAPTATQTIEPTNEPMVEPTQEPQPELTPEPTPEPTPPPFRNPLTGLPMEEDALQSRPFAVVMGNSQVALPQSGLAQANIIYEALSEGSVTRIIAIYNDISAARIGSVRSARDYFLHFAIDHDAIFVHHGQSPQGAAAIRDWSINNINGMFFDGSTFWRDPVRWRTPTLREHSSFTSAANLIYRANALRYRTTTTAEPIFQFHEEITELADGTATRITVPYTANFRPMFVFNEETQTYARYQFNTAHMDYTTGEQIHVTNVIVQIVNSRLIAGDHYGRRQFDLVGSGTGWLFTNGTYEAITWSKANRQSQTVWLGADGQPLTLNPGTTWVNVLSTPPVFE